jgi:hypothetical protein
MKLPELPERRLEFSCIAKVVQDHLAMPAAEVDVERTFNGGYIGISHMYYVCNRALVDVTINTETP